MHERPTLYLIDGSGYIYRAFFALPPLSTTSGLPTSAIYGFITMLQKVVRERRPDYLAVVFDEKGPTHRHQQFKEYKAQRRPMPDSPEASGPSTGPTSFTRPSARNVATLRCVAG